ncbi:MAG: hypothetical protein IPJ69_13905 [Deltaproteobacteria bacterium]|nr:MAG: hypothetical protein IPJ69_13905 [Deltaproteobacteria bacterium]
MSFGYDIKTAALRQFMPKVEQYPQIALALSIVLDPDRLHNDRIDAAKTAFELICRLVQPVEPQASTTVFSNLETTFEALAGIAAKIDTLPPPRPIVFEKLQDSDTLRTYLKRFGIHGSMTADEKSDFRARVEVNVETVLQYGLGGYGKEHKPSDLMILTKVCDYILSRQTPEQQSYGPRPDLLALAFFSPSQNFGST